MSYQVEGKLIAKESTKQVTDTFKSRKFAIRTEDQYPQTVQFELSQDRCSLLDGMIKEQLLKVSFNLRGREWVDSNGVKKYFNTLNCWKLEKLKDKNSQNKAIESAPQNYPSAPEPIGNDDDLPF